MDYARLFDDGSMIALGLVLLLMSRRKATKSADSDLVDSDLKKAEKRARRRASYRAVGLLLIAFGLVKTFYISPPWVANSSSLRWRDVTTTDGALLVRMPGEPEFHTETQKGVSGHNRLASQIVAVFDNTVIFSIRERHYLEADLPKDQSQILISAAQATLAQSKGKLIDEREVHRADVLGRQITVSMPKHFTVVTQFYQFGRCVYQLTAVTPEKMSGSPMVREFFDSLVFVRRAG